ncbi:hypothetical protein V2J09_023070 [Rumex salicifolius]
MKQHQSKVTNGFLPSSIKFLSSCVKTVSSGVRSAGNSVAAAISTEDRKDQVLWACFDRLELGPSTFKNVLLLGYINGFQVLDVDDATNVTELVSKRDDPCTFMQIQPIPAKVEDSEGFRASHPLLLVVAGNDTKGSDPILRRRDGIDRDGFVEPLDGNLISAPTNVRFYSMVSHNYVHVLRFRSAVYMVRCSSRIIAVGLASQIYCFDALTLESKLSVLTYPVPQSGGPQGINGINVGYGPMDVGPRWFTYTPNSPLLTSTGRLSPQNLTPSPGVSPSTSPVNGSVMARYAMESSKQLANGLINLGDMGYKTLSKYCQELLPDGQGSPISSSTGWKVGRGAAYSSETDNAGMVVVKDLVSNAVVSQFKAHSSPISALCFDPSGTLLVTASIHGNNINVFRIMPSCSQNGSGSQSYNWTSSHVHLYRLHRGITSAVIQDICFSRFSQWVSIVTSKGTCHVFVLSPFGGECGMQVQNYHADGPILAPPPSLPWWFASSFAKNQYSFSVPPPAPVTLSVVSRIRTGNSGWLNTVSSAASSAAGIASMTLDAVSAVFHCSTSSDIGRNGAKVNALEHLLVYSPSGHLIQYELVPSVGAELNQTSSRTGSGSGIHSQDEELRVKSEIVQWWDVCRRAEWPEREEHIGSKVCSGMGLDISDSDDSDIVGGGKGPSKLQERSHWYISNAEVQMSCGRDPVWQRSKIYFYTMSLTETDGMKLSDDSSGGEIEIEAFPNSEVEIRRKDLLPVFNQSQNVQSDWSDRADGMLRYLNVSENHLADNKRSEYSTVLPNKPLYPKVLQNSEHEFGPSTLSSELDKIKRHPSGVSTLVEKNVKRSSSISVSSQGPLKHYAAAALLENRDMDISPPQSSCVVNSPSPLSHMICATESSNPKEVQSSKSVGTSDASNTSSNRSDFSMNLDEGSSVHESYPDKIDFGQFFQEGYCKASIPPDECRDMREVVTDADSSGSPHYKEKSEEDTETDEMLGGVFAFAEEDIMAYTTNFECHHILSVRSTRHNNIVKQRGSAMDAYRQLGDYTASLFIEGILNEQFTQIQSLKDDSNPCFVVEVVTLFFEDCERLLNELANALQQENVDFKRLDAHVHQLKGSSSSIGAQKVENACIAFRTQCAEKNIEGCLECVKQVKSEYEIVKSKLEIIIKLEQQILAAGNSANSFPRQ